MNPECYLFSLLLQFTVRLTLTLLMILQNNLSTKDTKSTTLYTHDQLAKTANRSSRTPEPAPQSGVNQFAENSFEKPITRRRSN